MLSKDTVIILDCGEDSYGQLHRFYGREEAKRILQKVKAIFVSHMHGDHHLVRPLIVLSFMSNQILQSINNDIWLIFFASVELSHALLSFAYFS